MNDRHYNHDWSGEHAEKFAQSVEKLKKYRYQPFAKEIINAIKDYGLKKNPIILEVGSGPGNLLVELNELCQKCILVGVDSSIKMLEIAKSKLEQHKISNFEFKKGSAENIPIETDHIDVVVCLNSLHDFENSEQTINEVSRILVNGGLFILKDKNGAYPKWKMCFLFIPLIFRIGFNRTLKYFKSNKLWLDPDKVVEWMEKAGIKLKEVHYKKDYLIIGKKE